MDEQPGYTGFVALTVVNFADSVFDTDQISIIRGGSELARWLPYHVAGYDYGAGEFSEIADAYSGSDSLQPISLGGSKGFYISLEPVEAAQRLRGYLDKHPLFRYLSVEVAACHAPSEREANAILSAKITWQQLQSHRVRPDYVSNSRSVCQLTGVRAAAERPARFAGGQSGEALKACPSALARLEFGRALRRRGRLLSVVAGSEPAGLEGYRLSNSFEDIAGDAEGAKIAYLYFDGNGFGRYNQLAETANDMAGWDSYLRAQRAELMRDILHHADTMGLLESSPSDPETGNVEADKTLFRLEPLLWGGDESLLALPAASAFRVMSFIQERTQQWRFQYQTENSQVAPERLSHAFGLLFCSPKTPIREARRMAENLASLGKSSLEGRNRDSWSFAVLSSIDYEPDADMDKHLLNRYGNTLSPLLRGLGFPETLALEPQLVQLAELISRGQLRRLASCVVASCESNTASLDYARRRLYKQAGVDKQAEIEAVVITLGSLLQSATPDASAREWAAWAMLEELHEFLPVLPQSTAEEGA